ncbi:unnamed protein product, partial [Thlaspi arvense]
MVESGLYEPPLYINLVRKTHKRSDGNGRSETLVHEVEKVVAQMTAADGSPISSSQTTSTAATPSRILLNQEFLKVLENNSLIPLVSTSHGRVYGICSVQLRDFNPTESVHESLSHSMDMDMCISSLEVHSEAFKSNITELKQDVVAMKGELKE